MNLHGHVVKLKTATSFLMYSRVIVSILLVPRIDLLQRNAQRNRMESVWPK